MSMERIPGLEPGTFDLASRRTAYCATFALVSPLRLELRPGRVRTVCTTVVLETHLVRLVRLELTLYAV